MVSRPWSTSSCECQSIWQIDRRRSARVLNSGFIELHVGNIPSSFSPPPKTGFLIPVLPTEYPLPL
ncbi:hypothetical protein PEXP_027840 [Penicillium expansum]|nr:hypothetical protein PEXP_027840 [Penicillium expansum]